MTGQYPQAAVIPYCLTPGGLQILLITSRKKKKWIIPKGLIDPPDSPQQAAVQEAYEEAGIEGIVSAHFRDRYQYQKWDGICFVTVYAMHVDRMHLTWPEADMRERIWCRRDDVLNRVSPDPLRSVLSNFIHQYDSGFK